MDKEKKPEPNEEALEYAVHLYSKGYTVTELAEIMGCDESVIQERIEKEE